MTLFYSSGLHGRQTHFKIKVFLNSSSKPDKKPSKWRSYDSYAKYRICSWSYYKRWFFCIPRKNDITDDVISAAIYPHSYKYLPENWTVWIGLLSKINVYAWEMPPSRVRQELNIREPLLALAVGNERARGIWQLIFRVSGNRRLVFVEFCLWECTYKGKNFNQIIFFCLFRYACITIYFTSN